MIAEKERSQKTHEKIKKLNFFTFEKLSLLD